LSGSAARALARATPREIDLELYKARHLVKNLFRKLKTAPAPVGTTKTARNFLAAIHHAAATIWLN